MSKPQGKIVEGIFAINKPPSISSAQVIRNLQEHFNPSSLFAPLIAAETAIRKRESQYQRKRRRDKSIQVKIGHGGTLDPMATGVLIMGVGKGTKHLQGFLECTKSYEATMLFGAATETYDVLGKVLRRADYSQVTREKVEKSLEKFRGKIMQRPPLYSALRMDGKRLYEYAREGKEIPREIEQRPVEVKELEILEWMEGGSHDYKLPKEEAEVKAKDLADKVLHLGDSVAASAEEDGSGEIQVALKRKRSIEGEEASVVPSKKSKSEQENATSPALMSGGIQSPGKVPSESQDPGEPANGESDSSPRSPPDSGAGPPAVRLRMTVTSGFYVRSLSHDLGEAVGSLACMSQLTRTRQAEFELGKNVLEYLRLEKGEEVWAPELERLIEGWHERGKSPGKEEQDTEKE